MADPSRGAFINGNLVYNGHIGGNDDTVRQVESTNDLQTCRQTIFTGVLDNDDKGRGRYDRDS
jgi:hypothetical protein